MGASAKPEPDFPILHPRNREHRDLPNDISDLIY
jgi:hypothetical protein